MPGHVLGEDAARSGSTQELLGEPDDPDSIWITRLNCSFSGRQTALMSMTPSPTGYRFILQSESEGGFYRRGFPTPSTFPIERGLSLFLRTATNRHPAAPA
jgi:hypothetical protein